MANGNNNNQDPLEAINRQIADMEEAESQAEAEGLKPWEYNLAARTKKIEKNRIQQQSEQDIEPKVGLGAENEIFVSEKSGSRTIPPEYTKESLNQRYLETAQELVNVSKGDFTIEDMMPLAKKRVDAEIMRKQRLVKDQRTPEGILLETNEVSPRFDIAGEKYQLIDSDDKALRMVQYDEDGKISENSPVRVVGKQPNGKFILIAKEGTTNVSPRVFQETVTIDNYEDRNLKSTIEGYYFTDENKKLNDMLRNKLTDLSEISDPDVEKQIFNFQQTGVLR